MWGPGGRKKDVTRQNLDDCTFRSTEFHNQTGRDGNRSLIGELVYYPCPISISINPGDDEKKKFPPRRPRGRMTDNGRENKSRQAVPSPRVVRLDGLAENHRHVLPQDPVDGGKTCRVLNNNP